MWLELFGNGRNIFYTGIAEESIEHLIYIIQALTNLQGCQAV